MNCPLPKKTVGGDFFKKNKEKVCGLKRNVVYLQRFSYTRLFLLCLKIF